MVRARARAAVRVSAPTIALTNWSSRRLHGPGRTWTIMARPRAWEHGFGTVHALCPSEAALLAVRGGAIPLEAYRRQFEGKLVDVARELAPGRLRGTLTEPSGHGDSWHTVRDGDTLCCACSRVEASLGRCHRTWCAPALVAAGWHVLLDGQPWSPVVAS